MKVDENLGKTIEVVENWLQRFRMEGGVEVPWTWEKESRGQKPKSLKKVSKKVSWGRGPKVRKKSRKRSEKSKISLKNGFSETFRTFFETFSGLLGPDPGRPFRDFFETFWLLALRLLLPGPRNLKGGAKKRAYPLYCSHLQR